MVSKVRIISKRTRPGLHPELVTAGGAHEPLRNVVSSANNGEPAARLLLRNRWLRGPQVGHARIVYLGKSQSCMV